MSKEPLLLVTVENKIKTITFNLPKAKNPVNEEMLDLFYDEIIKTEKDDSRVVILTGAGGNFCSGAALNTENLSEFDVTSYLRSKVNPIVLGMRNCAKPFIAKVSGVCVGVGFNYALACDLIYATEEAVFSPIFTRIGLSSDGGGSFLLQQRVGYHKAFELMATGAMLNTQQAEKLGVINHVVPTASFDDTVFKMAEKLANGPYIAIQQTKKNLVEGESGDLSSTLEQEAVNQANNFKSQDFIEGVKAFMEKRKPNFVGA